MTTTNKKDEYQKNIVHKTQGEKEWLKHLEAPSASCPFEALDVGSTMIQRQCFDICSFG
jgi:hypothetical protein